MFTGIIESTGKITKIERRSGATDLTVQSLFTKELRVDQSIAHNGVCLTVTDILDEDKYKVTAVPETLKKTNLGTLKTEDWVNLERSMPANGRFDGHIVQGHVDQTAVCTRVVTEGESVLFSFEYDTSTPFSTVEKGSICVNGVSLTVINSKTGSFSVAVIPYTYQHTNFQYLKPGDIVNLEFDIVGKYLENLFLKYRFYQ